jgi:dihydrolipoamide dehydrogenase
MHDVVVIGCGPGGYAAAIRASQLGGKVAIVEGSDIGGTCVNRGCIPSKIWLRAAYVLNMIRSGNEFGIQANVNNIDFQLIKKRKDGVAGDIRMGMEALLGANGVDLIRGHGVVKNPQEVSVDSQTMETRKIILSTGSSRNLPDISGIKDAVMTTDEIMEMSQAPASVLIWGDAGTIDVEMATLLNTFGSKVHLATTHSRILAMEDHDTSQRLSQAFREQGIEILTRVTLTSVKKSKKGFKAELSGQKDHSLEIEKVLICSRKPNTANLGLQQTGMGLNNDGSLSVDEKLQTSVNGIYAVGDITGGWMNSQSASAMAVAAAENTMGQTNNFDVKLIPRGVWTFPQVGSVGLTEEEAEKEGFDVEIGDFPYTINGLAMSYGEMHGSVKIVSESENNEILGVHIVGPNATELVGEAVMALQLECTVDELAHTFRVHPTFSEALMDAGRDASGWGLYQLPK